MSLGLSGNTCSVSGYVVGYQELLKVEQATNGKYFINNVPTGDHDVVVTGSLAITNLLKAEKSHGKRLKKARFLSSVANDQGKVELPKMGSISGVVRLVDQNDHAGIDAYIPGTEYIAKTDLDGNYALSSVPFGEHNLFFEKDGYHRGQIEGIQIESDENTEINDVSLALSTGADGFVMINGGASIVDSRTINLLIGASEDTVLMKISETDNFEGASWIPLSTSTNYTFDTPGEKTLFIKFSNANGLESSPYRASVIIDIFSDGTKDFAPAFSVSSITPPQTEFTLSNITLPKNAVSMMISDQSTFSNATWESPTTTRRFSYNASYDNCGSKTFYLKFKDKDDFESPVGSQQTSLECWEKIADHPTIRSTASAITTNENLIIWGGYYGGSIKNDGEILNYSVKNWETISTTGAPTARSSHTAVWTGAEMIVWGGFGNNSGILFADGGRYDPTTDIWTNFTPSGSAPAARAQHTTIWTGDTGVSATSNRMIIFGGTSGNGAAGVINSGGIWNQGDNSWTAINASGAPSARMNHSAIWTGSKMIIWGGLNWNSSNFVALNDGDIYNPATDTWATMTNTGALSARWSSAAIWTGSKMLIWGGYGNSTYLEDGALYDPSNDSWTPMSEGPLTGRDSASVIKVGDKILLWGGAEQASPHHASNGALYDPSTDQWEMLPDFPAEHSSVYTVVSISQGIIIWSQNTQNIYLLRFFN